MNVAEGHHHVGGPGRGRLEFAEVGDLHLAEQRLVAIQFLLPVLHGARRVGRVVRALLAQVRRQDFGPVTAAGSDLHHRHGRLHADEFQHFLRLASRIPRDKIRRTVLARDGLGQGFILGESRRGGEHATGEGGDGSHGGEQ
jgi:hypothetical protein